MSGGVDSSVAALLLQQQGYDVTGVTLKLHQNTSCAESEGSCCSLEDAEDARRVAYKLGIPHYVMNFSDLFNRTVVENFVSEYHAGRTPNPCIICNRHIKFSAMLQRALEMDFDYIATGHYAKIEKASSTGRYLLKRAPVAKDQSYVLYSLSQQQLSHTLFPLSDIPKEQTRKLAVEFDLPVAHKSDSQEICFVPDRDYAAFIANYTGRTPQPGNFIDQAGNYLGKHKGILHYTIGQRKGLGVTFGKPMYVIRLDPDRNEVMLGEEGSQFASSLFASDVNYISIENLNSPMRVTAKVRYQAPPAPALLRPCNGGVQIDFDQPQRSVTPGQAVVFYDGDVVVGGGTIDYSISSNLS